MDSFHLGGWLSHKGPMNYRNARFADLVDKKSNEIIIYALAYETGDKVP